MSVPDTVKDGLAARAVFHAISVPPRRRRTLAERARRAVRSYAGMGMFLVMLVTSITLVVLSR